MMNTLLLAIALAAQAEAPKSGLEPTAAVGVSIPNVQEVREVLPVKAVGRPLPRIEVLRVKAVGRPLPRILEFAEVPVADACSFALILRKRFLSGAWSAARRLEAARLRDDAEEVKRMEAALDSLVDEATVLEGP